MRRLAACALVGGLVLAGAGCGGSGQSSGSTTAHSSRSLASSSSTSLTPAALIRAYWKDITSGRFRAAFSKFDRAEQQRSHGEHWFVGDKKRDAPIKAQLKLGAASVNRPLATVPIVQLRTVGSLTGCHLWTGTYRLRAIDSRWLIDAANLTKHSC